MFEAREKRETWLTLRLTPSELRELRTVAQREGVKIADLGRAGLALILSSHPAQDSTQRSER